MLRVENGVSGVLEWIGNVSSQKTTKIKLDFNGFAIKLRFCRYLQCDLTNQRNETKCIRKTYITFRSITILFCVTSCCPYIMFRLSCVRKSNLFTFTHFL